MAIGSALSIGLVGLKARVIHVQTFIAPGLPYCAIIGLPDTALSEARERVKSACHCVGFAWPQTRITVNMSPASLPKYGASHDLAIAASILGAAGAIDSDRLSRTLVLGELNLDGRVQPIHGILPMLLHARERGIREAIIPSGNAQEAALVPDIETRTVRHIGEFMLALGASVRYEPIDEEPESLWEPTQPDEHAAVGDMNEVIGQEHAKWALQVAAAGGHHMLLTGPPGSGKSMLASRLPGIMAPLDEDAQLEVASIRSICGTLQRHGISDVPPFEAPHHSTSTAALIGGGNGVARPGAITRAHHGVLFLDEAPECAPRTLQNLREPLETGMVTLSRAHGVTTYPARFQLIMAANPCPCGYGYGTGERCTCRERERVRYFARLSGPVLDRIDLQIQVPPVSQRISVSSPSLPSSVIRERVIQARERAAHRFAGLGWRCNAQASGTWLREHTPSAVMRPIDAAVRDTRLTLRGADRTLRLAWTLADLQARPAPGEEDIMQAITLRTRAA